MNRFTLAALSIAALLSACATPEARLRNGLTAAGLSRDTAACMADRMVDRLSLAQLQRLSDLSKIRKDRIGELTVGQFWRHIGALRDPEIISVATQAGLSCAVYR